MIFRHSTPTPPPQVTYGLTREGREFTNILDQIHTLAYQWQDQETNKTNPTTQMREAKRRTAVSRPLGGLYCLIFIRKSMLQQSCLLPRYEDGSGDCAFSIVLGLKCKPYFFLDSPDSLHHFFRPALSAELIERGRCPKWVDLETTHPFPSEDLCHGINAFVRTKSIVMPRQNLFQACLSLIWNSLPPFDAPSHIPEFDQARFFKRIFGRISLSIKNSDWSLRGPGEFFYIFLWKDVPLFPKLWQDIYNKSLACSTDFRLTRAFNNNQRRAEMSMAWVLLSYLSLI